MTGDNDGLQTCGDGTEGAGWRDGGSRLAGWREQAGGMEGAGWRDGGSRLAGWREPAGGMEGAGWRLRAVKGVEAGDRRAVR